MPNHLRVFCGPGGGGKVRDSLKGRVAKPRQDVSEVIAHWDFEPTTAFDDRHDRGYAWSGLLAPNMDPVAPANGDGPHRIFCDVGTEFQFRIIEEAYQPFPNAQRVGAAFAGSALGQHHLGHVFDVSSDLIQQRWSFLVA